MLDESMASAVTLEKTPVLEVSNATFMYPGSSQEALKGCTLRFEAGEKIAFIGKNGSGKTTFAQLIAKVYLATSGDVLVDGTSIRTITQKSWIEQFLYIKPPTRVPELTLREVFTAVEPEEVDEARLQKALEYAGAKDIIDEMPDGLDTQLGQHWPGGRDVSSGQYQRFALVLAFYRLLHPSVRMAIFDEAMAHCDLETKGRFYPLVAGETGDFADKTIITILHDQQFVPKFGRIVEFEEGLIKRDLKNQVIALASP
ncbi:MAG: ABC transporter related protein [Candidatus Kaiserbacteria bacterium GW2011_GWB1_52_6]|nr:MAG: ABC transporter related protein [Candidatus Kaiserbacteria bacterium GW2011_GWB1_52_6]